MMNTGRPTRRSASPALGVAAVAAAVIASTLSACAPLGPSTIDWSRTHYNEALQQTEAQQLLLNIVRQRYSDPVMFLDVTAISNSTTRSANLSLGANFQRFVFGGGNIGTGGAVAESPIIFYAPNTGEKFVRQILTQIDIRTISLLLQSGWSIERVLMVAGDSINGIRNTNAGRDSNGQPPYAQYRDLVDALRDLQRDGLLTTSMEASGAGGVDTLVFTPSSTAIASEPYLKVCKTLGLGCDGRAMRLQIGVGAPPTGSGKVVLTTRSLYAAFYFLSEGVDVPPGDLQKGYVKPRESSGGPFDRASGDLFRVLSSSAEPSDSAVKVRYRNTWYFIADSDLDSKTTFGLLNIMLMLEGSDISRVSPLVSVSPG
ncbi:MAG: hypothetical protein EPO08_16260 [Rhodospirillaceae bacterium]|nr:MAG: hypothetical protein EPO08_16260 [Rhodospirillaceae bacterium]